MQTAPLQRQEEEVQTAPLQRQEEEEVQTAPLQRQEEEEVQTASDGQRDASGGFAAGGEFEEALGQARGGGQPLPSQVRREFEPSFGADFSGVRVHTGSDAAGLNQAIQARAFTHGQDIYMGAGQYDSGSTSGKRLLAHELTHTIQQTGGQRAVQRASKEQKEANKATIKQALEVVSLLRSGKYAEAQEIVDQHIPSDVLDESAAWYEKGKLFKKMGGIYKLEQLKSQAKVLHQRYDSANDDKEKEVVAQAVKKFAMDNYFPLMNEVKKLSSSGAVRIISKLAFHLMSSIDPDVVEEDRQIKEMRKGLNTQYMKLETSLEPYATRAGKTWDVNRPEDLEGILAALAVEKRGTEGELLDEAIDMIEQDVAENERTSSGYFGQMEDITKAGGVKVNMDLAKEIDQLKAMLRQKGNLNPITGRTNYPELLNIKNPLTDKTLFEEMPDIRGKDITDLSIPKPTGDDVDVTATMDVSGTAMTVTYNKSDMNFPERFSLLKQAVAKIKAAGITNIPALDVHIPKTGRALSVTADNPPMEGTKVSRNEFVAPSHLHMSSAALGTPLDSARTYQGKKEYVYSSTALDPSGVATLIHEFGHVLHYYSSPSKYHGLHGASFKGPATQVANQVSGYAGQKPREFVAEAFMGAVYGRTFSTEVSQMYQDLGGPSLSGLVPQGTGNLLAPT